MFIHFNRTNPVREKSVNSVATNDARYLVRYRCSTQKKFVVCPYYRIWTNMLSRVYGTYYDPLLYKGCSVHADWMLFSTFRQWLVDQDYYPGKNIVLDKDLLVPGNKIYGPDTCYLISQKINRAIARPKPRHGKTGNAPQGVCYIPKDKGMPRNKPYRVTIKVLCGTKAKVFHFFTEEEAVSKWRKLKSCQLIDLSYRQTDEVVASALRTHAKLISKGELT